MCRRLILLWRRWQWHRNGKRSLILSRRISNSPVYSLVRAIYIFFSQYTYMYIFSFCPTFSFLSYVVCPIYLTRVASFSSRCSQFNIEYIIWYIFRWFILIFVFKVMRKPVRKTSLFKFMTVLRLEVWLSIVGALTSTGIMIWILDKYSPYSARNNKRLYPYPCRYAHTYISSVQ